MFVKWLTDRVAHVQVKLKIIYTEWHFQAFYVHLSGGCWVVLFCFSGKNILPPNRLGSIMFLQKIAKIRQVLKKLLTASHILSYFFHYIFHKLI